MGERPPNGGRYIPPPLKDEVSRAKLMIKKSPQPPAGGKDQVVKKWTESVGSNATFSNSIYWLATPEVQRRYQQKATQGKYRNWAHYCVREFLGERIPVERMLSIGCGKGGLERNLAGIKAFQACDAIDITPASIQKAQEQSQAVGLFNINYRVADVETEVFPAEHYDAVWFNGSLHHIEALEKVCAKLARTIKTDGYLFFNEYIGPSRFDFSERQKAVMQAAFELIPQRFRRCFIPGYPYEYKREISAPNPAQVSKVDPSEAVRSSEILEIVKEYFDIVVKNDTGGTILQFLLAGIAGNFRSDDPDSMSTLQMLFTIEDTLIKVGDIQSDFAVVVARPKS